MKTTDDAQRPTAGELMNDQETQRPDEGQASQGRADIRELAEGHREGVAQGRAQVGEADPDAGQNAHDHRGSIHPKAD